MAHGRHRRRRVPARVRTAAAVAAAALGTISALVAVASAEPRLLRAAVLSALAAGAVVWMLLASAPPVATPELVALRREVADLRAAVAAAVRAAEEPHRRLVRRPLRSRPAAPPPRARLMLDLTALEQRPLAS